MTSANSDEHALPPLFDFHATWHILWARRRAVLATMVIALLAALLYLAVTKPRYTATASVLIDPRDSRATNLSSVLPGIGADSAAIASQVFVIESRNLLIDVFKTQGMDKDPEFADRGLLARLFSLFSSEDSSEAAFKRFQDKVSVERKGLTYVVNVNFASESSDKAARIANAIVNHYKASLSKERELANNDANTLLTERIGSLQKSVSDADRAIEDFKVEHNILTGTAGGTLQSQIDQLTTQLITAQNDVDQAQDKYNLAQAAGTSVNGLARLSRVVSSGAIDRLRDDYNQRATALANSAMVYGPRHPVIERQQSELERVRWLMAAEAGRIQQERKSEYNLAVQTARKLQSKLDDLRNQSKSSDIAQVQLRQLEARAQATRVVLDDFLKRAQETLQMQGLQPSEARVIATATAPARPTWPRPSLILPASALLGLIFGSGLALMLGPLKQK
ncbi:MAG TPA: GumC family protein [Beijerinckiaceae bacterium]|jgi:uncharacterized protein involved in exopolysaccharide biosynthesis|nr:GumC family protein [Beijerinckiaceae bacterium]